MNAFGERASALHEAALRNDTELAEQLLAAGAERAVRDREYGATPAGWASFAGHTELAERLTP